MTDHSSPDPAPPDIAPPGMQEEHAQVIALMNSADMQKRLQEARIKRARVLEASNAGAAMLTFKSVHPRWCYVRATDGVIEEAVEKNPVSNQAVAGVYFFKSGELFSELAMKAIINGRDVDSRFYTSSVINEYILKGEIVLAVDVANSKYHSLYTGRRLREYDLDAR